MPSPLIDQQSEKQIYRCTNSILQKYPNTEEIQEHVKEAQHDQKKNYDRKFTPHNHIFDIGDSVRK